MAKKPPTKQGMPTDKAGKRMMLIRPRGMPTEELVKSQDAAKRTKDGETVPMDMSPALTPAEFAELQTLARDCTPEQFQTALSQKLQRMIVVGLQDMPAPKSIKELESLIRLYRQTSGLEAKDKAGGGPSGGFLPRVVTRRSVGLPVEAEVVTGNTDPPYEELREEPTEGDTEPEEDLPSFF